MGQEDEEDFARKGRNQLEKTTYRTISGRRSQKTAGFTGRTSVEWLLHAHCRLLGLPVRRGSLISGG